MSKFQATSEGDVLVLRIPVESINQVTVTTDFTGWGVDPVMFLTLDVNESGRASESRSGCCGCIER